MMTKKEMRKNVKMLLKGYTSLDKEFPVYEQKEILEIVASKDISKITKLIENIKSGQHYLQPRNIDVSIEFLEFLEGLEEKAAIENPKIFSKISKGAQNSLKNNIAFAKKCLENDINIYEFSENVRTDIGLFNQFSDNILIIGNFDLEKMYKNANSKSPLRNPQYDKFVPTLKSMIYEHLDQLTIFVQDATFNIPELTNYLWESIPKKSYENALEMSKKNGKSFYENFSSEINLYNDKYQHHKEITEYNDSTGRYETKLLPKFQAKELYLRLVRHDGMKLGDIKRGVLSPEDNLSTSEEYLYLDGQHHQYWKNDPEIICEALRENGMALQFVSDDFCKKYPEIVCEALRENGMALQFVPNDLKKDLHIVQTALEQNKKAVEFLKDTYISDNKLKKLIEKTSKEVEKDNKKAEKEANKAEKANKKLEEKAQNKKDKKVKESKVRDPKNKDEESKNKNNEIANGITLEDLSTNGSLLEAIPHEHQTLEIINTAIKNDIRALKYADITKLEPNSLVALTPRLVEDLETFAELKDTLEKIEFNRNGIKENLSEFIISSREQQIAQSQTKLRALREQHEELSKKSTSLDEKAENLEIKLDKIEDAITKLEGKIKNMGGELEK